MTSRKFLLVDDDHDDVELFAEAVGSVAANVRCLNAAHGREALEKLSSKELERPDLIFLDINMPIMDGWQFLSTVKGNESLKAIPVIMYSTSSKHTDLKNALSSGALCFFTKPTSFVSLKQILQIVVDYMERGILDKVCEAIRGHHGKR